MDREFTELNQNELNTVDVNCPLCQGHFELV